MSRSAQTQLDLFAEEPVLKPAVAWEPPLYAPYPQALLRRLGADLRMLQRAERMPWPTWRAAGEIRSFLACVERLPPDLRGDLAEAFQREIARLT